ncbi:MAG: hypothetical protein M1438_07020 [Deltaproteobacteria bacterium]|nr:hypothetical protein [Deltaproteobacteria bacterium]
MNINVPSFAQAHFWEEPPEGHIEFWAFRFKPPCQMGDDLIFRFDGQPVAKARVAFIEGPGKSKCRGTGKFERHWKVFWRPETFKDLRNNIQTEEYLGPLFS